MNYEIYSYLCGKLQTRIAIISMATTIRETESGIRTSGMDTAEALWTIIAAQPRKVRKELAIRLQNDLSSTRHRITELDKAIEDVKMGRLSGPFSTPEELIEHLKI